MLTCQITDNTLIFEWPENAAVKGTQTHRCKRGKHHTLKQSKILVQCVINVCSRLSPSSYNAVFKGLDVIIATLTTDVWPTHNDTYQWQNIVVTMFEKTLKRSLPLETKITYWYQAQRILKELSRAGAIPPSVTIPHTKNNIRLGENATPPIGYNGKKIKAAKLPEDILPKKFIIERDLHKPDDIYLSEFKSELESSINIVSDSLNNYWEEMLKTHAIGKSLIDSLPIQEREIVPRNNGLDDNGVHVCSPSNTAALPWLLFLIKNMFESGQISELSVRELHRKKIGVSKKRITALFQQAKKICPTKYLNRSVASEHVSRLIGTLSALDCNAAIAILVINNPSFTPEAISKADLYMENGDCYLQLDTDNGHARFSISKPRALSRKVSYLNKISRTVVSTIVDCTFSFRCFFKERGDRNWRRLFLYMGSRGPATNPKKNSNNSIKKGSLRSRLSVDLANHKTSIDLSPRALRATQGIIAFLRTGSLAVAAMVLGNTIDVTETNYVPRWLVKRFANRTHRILTQKLIVVATHGYPWALDASDFLTSDYLHLFIVRILEEATGNDPFAVIARRRLSANAHTTTSIPPKTGDLYLRIHSSILAALYSYDKKVSDMPQEEQFRIHPTTNLSHQSVCSIAKLFKSIAEIDIDTASEADFQVALILGGDCLDEMKAAHQQALLEVPYYDSVFINAQHPK
ncbi:hypothetical protein [Pseudomonas sp. BBP2017]|uniref:hypothetical protein n=1 Tax=Pseudomonas sp. BBP2017 TaxID=2109731 RepID=UPI000D11E0DA|nr:hypothetical protein [Pseudomonas sp. BBP2017]PSS59186.1 hypothetical protein C6382_02160 [Pseudomonas sp. BBP2017]